MQALVPSALRALRSFRRGVCCVVALACAVLTAGAAAAAFEPVLIDGCGPVELAAGRLGVMHDPTGRLRADEADAVPFEPVGQRRLGLGVRRGAVWLRFTLAPGAGCGEPMFFQLGNPFVNRVAVHRRTQGGAWQPEWRSDAPDAAGGPPMLRHAGFLVRPMRSDAVHYLVEVRGPAAIMAAPEIVPASLLAQRSGERMLLSGIMAGGVVSLALYCAVLALQTRMRGVLAFALSGIALALFYGVRNGLADGVIAALLPPGSDPHEVSMRATAVALAVAALCHWCFVRGLLGASSLSWRSPRQGLLPAAWCALVAAIPFTGSRATALLSVAICAVALGAMLYETCAALRRRHPLAGMTAAALAVLMAAAGGFIAMYLGLLPWHPLYLQSTAAGVWVEAILVSAAVGAHVKDLRGEHQRLAARTHELSTLSLRDPLSCLGNRRAFDAIVPERLADCTAAGAPVTLLALDIDHFKRVNDRHGHAFGDAVIRALGATLLQSIRADDLAFRYGGEEFVVLLPGMDADRAVGLADRIMAGLRHSRLAAPDGSRPVVSVSIGVSSMSPGDTAATLFARADAALYRAKRKGRARTELDGAAVGAA